MQFQDRREAGLLLGQKLGHYAGKRDVIVLALPRGGVPVAFEVALVLKAPLEVFLVRKLGLPGNPELAMGAIASGGACILNEEVIQGLEIPPELIQLVIDRESAILKDREAAYGTLARAMDLSGKTAILVDDGAATGATMRVAVQALRHHHEVRRIVVALPTAATKAATRLRMDADEVVTLCESDQFISVGQWYQIFDQTSDEEVIDYLQKAAEVTAH